MGYPVSVYCGKDPPLKDRVWIGVMRVLIANPEKYLGTAGQFIYALLSNLHSWKQPFDIILHLGYTSDSLWFPFWKKNCIHIVNMDGLEWKRKKYSRIIRCYLRFAEWLATRRASILIADSKAIYTYLEKKYQKNIRYIPYGAIIPATVSEKILNAYGLSKYKYDLLIARTEPENNIETAIQAKRISGSSVPLVLIGNPNAYRKEIMDRYRDDKTILFLDGIYDPQVINALRYFCRIYIHGHSVGGTNPSLLEAMACSCNIIAHNNPFNQAILGRESLYFNREKDLSAMIGEEPASFPASWKTINLEKIKEEFNWETVTLSYVHLFSHAHAHQ